MTDQYFFYGTLRDEALLTRVLGRAPQARAAWISGHAVRAARAGGRAQGFPVLVAEAGARAEGVLVAVRPEEAARLDYYEAGYSDAIREVETAAGPERARVYLAQAGRWQAGELFDFAAWQARWGALARETAADFMAGFGRIPAEQALARYPSLLVRAASRLRARGEAFGPETAAPGPAPGPSPPAPLRHAPAPGDVVVEAMTPAYARFFAVEEYRLRHRKFSGAMTEPLERAAFVSADATVVLPYDPVRDRVLLVEQFRAGPFARGDRNPWSLETIAGRIDPGERPEDAARREAGEEAGLSLGRLIAAPNFYPSPGAKTEYIYSFIALCDLPEGAARPGGVAEEGEDIRPHLLSFDELMARMSAGEFENGPLIVLTLWLSRLRAGLRAEAVAGGAG